MRNAGLAEAAPGVSMKMAADTFLRARKSEGEGRIDHLLLLRARNSQWDTFTLEAQRRLTGTSVNRAPLLCEPHRREVWTQHKGVICPLKSGKCIYPRPSPLGTCEGGKGGCHQAKVTKLIWVFAWTNWACAFRLRSTSLKALRAFRMKVCIVTLQERGSV